MKFLTIYQGHNNPLPLVSPEDMEQALFIRVQLSDDNGEVLKLWEKDDISINGRLMICPVTQAESATWPVCRATVDVHWIDSNEVPKCSAKPIRIQIYSDNDKTVMGTDDPITVSDGVKIDLEKLPAPLPVGAEMQTGALVVEVAEVSDDAMKETVETWLTAHESEIKGEPGEDGFSPSASVSKTGTVSTLTVTDEAGTTTVEIKDGEKGEQGEPYTHSDEFTALAAQVRADATAAGSSATSAARSETAAAASAETAGTSATVAHEAQEAAESAKADAVAAGSAAAESATEAAGSAVAAAGSATAAGESAAGSSDARAAAEMAQGAAESAKTAAETARDEAVESAQSISGKSDQIDTNTENISQIKLDISEVNTSLTQKLTKPSTCAVGQYFRVASLDSEGNPVLEAVSNPAKLELTDTTADAWTTAQKTAACERIGASQYRPMKLLETITLDGTETIIERNYNVKSIAIYFKNVLPSDATENRLLSCVVSNAKSGMPLGGFYYDSWKASRYTLFKAFPVYGMWQSFKYSAIAPGSYNGNYSANTVTQNTSLERTYPSIGYEYISFSVTPVAGGEILIYGAEME